MTKRILSLLLTAVLVLGLVALPVQGAAASVRYAGAVTTAQGSLNVRSQASASAPVVATLQKGSRVTLIARSGSWWQVEYAKNSYGYCHSSYITPIDGTAATVKLQSGSLNVRSGPGTNYAAKDWLQGGEQVVVLSSGQGWSWVLYHGTKTGYVSAAYLTGSGGNSSIRLGVPDFKQTDSRWANVTIGTSGKTIAQIGCATTALAMMESYRTGKTIYPDAMAKKLSYTPSGSVYWPSSYIAVTSQSGYLSRVLQLLQSGKPVLLGAKNRYGGQHWVVITGFAGGSLTPASFQIHDPGTGSRTNLQQFLDAYPTFYKYFYYD